MWNKGWDNIFEKHEWGKYPPEEVIRFVARTAPEISERKNLNVLEIGCGTGANLWYLAREGFSTYGLDGSKVALERATSRLKQENLTAQLTQGDAMQLPYPSDFFDLVLDVECIYANTMKDSRVILSEVARVLKKGGGFFSKTFMVGTYGDGMGPTVPGEPNTYQELTEGALRPGYGVIRFSSEDDIRDLYGCLDIQNLDYIMRSENNRSYEVKEWLVTCRKA